MDDLVQQKWDNEVEKASSSKELTENYKDKIEYQFSLFNFKDALEDDIDFILSNLDIKDNSYDPNSVNNTHYLLGRYSVKQEIIQLKELKKCKTLQSFRETYEKLDKGKKDGIR